MSLADTLYQKAPVFVKLLLLNAKAATYTRKRYRSPYSALLRQHKELWYKDIEDVRSYQQQRLVELLLEAQDYSPWYQEQFRVQGVTREAIRDEPFWVLGQLPMLSKAERKLKLPELLSRNPARKVVDVGLTSGSTGEPMRVPRDQVAVSRTFALLDRYYWTIGLPEGKHSVRLSGRQIVDSARKRPPFWMYNHFEKQLFVSTYHLNEEFIPAIIDKLNYFKPHLIDGYPSACYVIGQYLLQREIKLSFVPIAISSTAETLYPFQRELLEQAFGCPVYNQYASADGSPFISQCVEGNLHLHLDTGVFEFINNAGEPAAPGEVAEMVVTSFRNLLVPLIRYRIGDMVQLRKDQTICACGCAMPMIDMILGRDDDLTVATNGALIGMAAFRLFKDEPAVLRAQVLQPSRTELVLRLVPEAERTELQDLALVRRAKAVYGSDMRITVHHVDSIPLGPNGKMRAVIRQFPL